MTLTEQAEQFMGQLFHLYLEQRDFDGFITRLSPGITWIGTGQHEICHNYTEAMALLAAEEASWDGHFHILSSWYLPVALSADSCMVFGELRLREDSEHSNQLLMELCTRFSAVCHRHGEELRLLHIHFSAPSESQQADEFVHKTLLQGYNLQLEQRLEERTAILIRKTNELEHLTQELQQENRELQMSEQIDDEKRHLRIADEQRLYEAILASSTNIYEVNLTQNLSVNGHESWDDMFGIQPTSHYTEMIQDFARVAVCKEDAPEFLRIFDRLNALACFEAGIADLYCEYRRPDLDLGIIWVSCTMHLFQDAESGDVRGFSYVQNIHERKLKQLELLYQAERDQLTGLYNKAKTQQAIDNCLSDEGRNQRHALFIFDLDHFKEINDTMGHAFGDVVLSRAAGKVQELFRDDDITGRVGGDEFVVFMKNIASDRIAETKGREICDRLRDIYTHEKRKLAVSISVGTALYPAHGTDYHTLFEHADIALYTAKENGRNQAALYRETLSPAPSRVADMDVSDLLEARSFQRNVSEYIFRILYETSDKTAAINSVLEVMGKQYCVSRSYIFEETEDGQFLSNTFEWCNNGITPQIATLQNLSYEQIGYYPDNFDDRGIFYLSDARQATPNLERVLSPQSIKTLLQFAILSNDQFYGMVGFDFCENEVEPTKAEITVLKTAANMLGVFLTEMRAMETTLQLRNVALSIADALESYAYVIDRASYSLLFINRKTRSVAPLASIGDQCFQAFWGLETPCERCPMQRLTEEANSRSTMEMTNHHLNKRTRATASWIDWINGVRACLLDCVDIGIADP